MNKFNVKILTILVLGFSLISCGGSGGGGSGSSEDTISKIEINATVIDGYLKGAKVWLDVNDNFEFDEGEPFAVSGELGKVTLDVTGIDNPNSCPIVAQAVKDETIDESTGDFVTYSYVMSAPKGEVSITPLSTMVHLYLEQNSNGVETPEEFSSKLSEAKDAVASSLGINKDDVLGDYIEGSKGDVLYAAENIVASGMLPEGPNELKDISIESTGNSQFNDDMSSVKESIKSFIDYVNLNGEMSFKEQPPVYKPLVQGEECGIGFVQDGVICIVDSDNDAIGNDIDTDDDGDGVADSSDAFPLDATESLDTDGDNIGNNADNDDDNDGVADSEDKDPLINSEDALELGNEDDTGTTICRYSLSTYYPEDPVQYLSCDTYDSEGEPIASRSESIVGPNASSYYSHSYKEAYSLTLTGYQGTIEEIWHFEEATGDVDSADDRLVLRSHMTSDTYDFAQFSLDSSGLYPTKTIIITEKKNDIASEDFVCHESDDGGNYYDGINQQYISQCPYSIAEDTTEKAHSLGRQDMWLLTGEYQQYLE